VNVVGVREGARTAVVLVVTKTLPLLLFILVGVFFVDWSLAFASGPAGTGDLGEAALLLLFAYAGFENAPAAAGEYRNPQRDVPFALLTMIAIITAIYTAVQVVAQGTLPGLGEAESPLAEAAAQFMGSGFALLMTVGAIISIFGNIANTTLLGPRYAFALAQDGYGPRALASVHPKYRTPWIAVIAQSIIALVLALTGSFVQLAMLSIIARLATYIGTAASVPFLRRKYGATRPGFRLPGGPTIPILALLVSFAFLSSAEPKNLVAGAIALAIGAGIYALRRRGTAASD
jgi:amino acid transporter